MQNQSPLRFAKKDLANRSRLVRLLLVLVPLVLLLTVIPWPGSVKQAHAATITCPPTIQYGSDNNTVGMLQADLNLIDPYIFNLSVDDQFGQHTYDAVVTFQKAANIQDNGQVGPQTWSELGQCKTSGGISGGGCTTANGLEACISWSGGMAIADGYVRSNMTGSSDFAGVMVGAYSTYYSCGSGYGKPYYCAYVRSPANGTHVASSQCDFTVNTSGYGYVSYLEGYNGSSYVLAVSPVQWAVS